MTSELNEVEKEISLILRKQWNPIGFDDNLPMDEYDRYAPRVYDLICEDCSEYFLAAFLCHIETNVIGLKENWYKSFEVSKILIEKYNISKVKY